MMNTVKTTSHHHTLEQALAGFVRAAEAKNRSASTVTAYRGDLTQFFQWLRANDVTVEHPGQITRTDVTEYLAQLGRQQITGLSRARKLAVLREFFRYLVGTDVLVKSPTDGVETPKKEKNSRTILSPDEYARMLSLAGSHPRDFCILTLFLQTGVRVSELCDLRLDDIDITTRMLRVRNGKGMVARDIELERKGIQAIRNWMSARPSIVDDHLFLNLYDEPLGDRGVKKLVTKYRRQAGITKRAGCHSFRHTFATHKAEKGVSPFQLKEWLGHARLDTTQIYVHLARKNAKKEMEATSL